MINKILSFIALGVFSGLVSAEGQTAAPGPARVGGQIVAARVQGRVTAISNLNLENRLLRDGDQVSEKTTIVTGAGASVILVFSNGATVDIAGDSRLNVTEFEQDPLSGGLKAAGVTEEPGTSATKLNLVKGELTARVVHLNVDKGSEFTIQTPVGAAGIRGTFLRVIFRPGKDHKATFSVETFEGLVLFTGLASGPVDIAAGHKFEATFEYNPANVDNPVEWVPPPSLTLRDTFISPLEAAQFQAELQAILTALGNIEFNGVPTSPPPPAPPLNPPTPGAGSGP
jgi:hypothetical protein